MRTLLITLLILLTTFPAYAQTVCPRCGKVHKTPIVHKEADKAPQTTTSDYLNAVATDKALKEEKARREQLEADSVALKDKLSALEEKLAKIEDATTPKPTTVQPIPDTELIEATKGDQLSQPEPGPSDSLDPDRFPSPSQIEAEPIAANMSASGRWTMGTSKSECERVDRIMSEMASEFGYDLDALESRWTKFPVCFIATAGYAGCTYWNGSAVDRINIVSQYDDKSDRVLRHELIHAVLFYLTNNDTSLFMHEATTQQAEPGVRSVYVRKMQAALAADKPELSTWVDRNSYDNNLRLYTFGYGVSEYLVSLGGKEWYFGFVLDYGKVGFSEALARWYGMSYRQFSDGLYDWYLNKSASRSNLKTLIKD